MFFESLFFYLFFSAAMHENRLPHTSHAVGGLNADKRGAINATGGKKSGLERIRW